MKHALSHLLVTKYASFFILLLTNIGRAQRDIKSQLDIKVLTTFNQNDDLHKMSDNPIKLVEICHNILDINTFCSY